MTGDELARMVAAEARRVGVSPKHWLGRVTEDAFGIRRCDACGKDVGAREYVPENGLCRDCCEKSLSPSAFFSDDEWQERAAIVFAPFRLDIER